MPQRREAPPYDFPMTRLFPLTLTAVLLMALGCHAPAPTAQSSPESMSAIVVRTIPVPLAPDSPSVERIGDFYYAGGLALSTAQTDRLHGLSDLHVGSNGQLLAIGDEGVLFEGRLTFDGAHRLIGLTDTRLGPLLGENGKPLPDKSNADAEGLAVFDNGSFLVSFERRDRILLYRSADATPSVVPSPQWSFGENSGMEALTLLPDAATDAYAAGAEYAGNTWTCRLSVTPCGAGAGVDLPTGFALVAMRSLSGGRMAYLLRSFSASEGNRNTLRIVEDNSVLGTLDLQPPLTVDNFEGLAAVQTGDRNVRFYLLSDDNGRSSQRTLLLAFDWRPN